MKGFRFHPTDEELIEHLQIKTFDRDSLVQFIDEVPDICESEPWELPGRSRLQTGDRLWYFMYPPKYKYRNSKRISRTTREGYWKPTGNARQIIDSNTGEVIGSKKTLVFYKGQCNEKNRNKTCWVMHEYELKVVPKPTSQSNQDQIKTFNLCKLKKRIDFSSNSDEAGQSSQHSLSNLENNVANYAILEALLNPDGGSSEPEASNVSGVVHDPASSFETFAGERSNQRNVVNEDEGSNLSSNFIHHVAEDAIPKEPLDLKEVSTERNGPNENDWVQYLNSTLEQDNQSCNSILTNDDESVPTERSNQHNIVAAESVPIERSNQHNIVVPEGFKWPSSLEHLDNEDLIPTDLLYNDGLSLNELSVEPKATNNSNWIQNQYIINIEDGGFLNSNFVENRNNKVYLQQENTEQCLAANNEGFTWPCIDVMESSNSMQKSRKRLRLQYDGLSDYVETSEAQPCGE